MKETHGVTLDSGIVRLHVNSLLSSWVLPLYRQVRQRKHEPPKDMSKWDWYSATISYHMPGKFIKWQSYILYNCASIYMIGCNLWQHLTKRNGEGDANQNQQRTTYLMCKVHLISWTGTKNNEIYDQENTVFDSFMCFPYYLIYKVYLAEGATVFLSPLSWERMKMVEIWKSTCSNVADNRKSDSLRWGRIYSVRNPQLRI